MRSRAKLNQKRKEKAKTAKADAQIEATRKLRESRNIFDLLMLHAAGEEVTEEFVDSMYNGSGKLMDPEDEQERERKYRALYDQLTADVIEAPAGEPAEEDR